MLDTYVYDGIRTPFGRHAGVLAAVRPDDLMGDTIAALLARGPFKGEAVEDVVIGCTNQAGEDSRNVARRAALRAGLPVEVAGITVNRLCASGLAAVLDAARAGACGQGDLFVAGGVESMSRAPFVMGKAERPYHRQLNVFDSTIGSRFPNPAVTKRYGDDSMPETADTIGRDLGIGREESDRFALASQEKYAKAKAECFYKDELRPVEVPALKRGEITRVAEDEHPRPDTSLEKLARLTPLFPRVTPPASTTARPRSSSAPRRRATASGRSRWCESCQPRRPAWSRASWVSGRCPRRGKHWRGRD
jgi:acetyl-CoA C-acetyltransferase